MKLAAEEHERKDFPVSLLLGLGSVIVASLYLLGHNVVYTEGEVMQGVFTFSVFVTTAVSFLLGCWRRKAAAWWLVIVGGSLLLWQVFQTRKWTMIHEDILGLVKFCEDRKKQTGEYPATVEGYQFEHPWVRNHLHGYSRDETNHFGLSYFMNDPGITYWYSSRTGFGYYPD